MKKYLLVLVALVVLICVNNSFGQIKSNSSSSVTFQANTVKSKASGVSGKLNYNVTSSSTKISGISNVLYFGMAKPVANNTVTQEIPTPKQEVQVAQESKPTTGQSSPIVSEPAIVKTDFTTSGEPQRQAVIASGSKELGEDYASSTPKYRALLLGVSEYKYSGAGLPSLANPTKDAQQLYELLTTKYAFDTADVKYIKNPTRQQIIDALEMLSSEVGEKDNLLVFYAGHGYYDKIKEFGYWLPSDASATSRSEWIPNSTVKDYLSAIRSKHTLLITDACFGGSIFKTRAVDANTMLRVHELYKDPSRKAITSGNLSEVPDKSPFIEFMLRKLDENEDKYLPAQKLFSRIYEPVSNNSSATPQFGVIQGAGDQGGDFIFIKKSP